jgi:excinuclease ABC subunit C
VVQHSELPWVTLPVDGLDVAPESPGVTLIEPPGGAPYLGRTRNLRRRLHRLMRLRLPDGRTFGESAAEVRYWAVGSSFEADWRLWRTGRAVWPENYRRRLRLHGAPLVKAHLGNRFPRTSVTTRLTGGRSLFFGPFRSRTAAEDFQDRLLDFFKVRRCVENLEPSPDHPGCIYGEMDKCLRPCQQAVSVEDYRRESGRLLEALASRGTTLRSELVLLRDQASEELEFEAAARWHRRAEQLDSVLAGLDESARDLDSLHGVIVQRAVSGDAASLFPLFQGRVLAPLRLDLGGHPAQISLDRQVREAIDEAELTPAADLAERQDSLALLRRWLYSSWRQGEFVVFEGFDRIPYRKVVNAISRVVSGRPDAAVATAAMRRAAKQGPSTSSDQSGNLS